MKFCLLRFCLFYFVSHIKNHPLLCYATKISTPLQECPRCNQMLAASSAVIQFGLDQEV